MLLWNKGLKAHDYFEGTRDVLEERHTKANHVQMCNQLGLLEVGIRTDKENFDCIRIALGRYTNSLTSCP